MNVPWLDHRFFTYTILPGIIIGLLCFSFIHEPALELFPKNDTYFEHSTLSDGNFESGNSTTALDTSNRHLQFKYTLGDSATTPYAMMIFHAHNLFRPINLSQYSTIEITLHPEETSDFTITLYTYIPGISNEKDSDTHRPYRIVCRPTAQKTRYRFHLSQLETPSWWFNHMNSSASEIPSTEWDKITHLSLSDATQKRNAPLTITIEQILFRDSLAQNVFYALLSSLFSTLFLALIYTHKKRSLHTKQSQRIKEHTSKTSFTPDEADLVLTYMNKQYSNPLLTIEIVAKHTNISPYIISEIIASQQSMRFKTYLHNLRISKAKELLIHTNLPIGTIAEQVGYCYTNTLSRIFKETESIPPKSYRKRYQEGEVKSLLHKK